MGTIVHFAGLNAGVVSLVKPIDLDRATTHLHLPVAVGSTLAPCALLARGRGLGRREGALLLVLYAAYVAAAIAAG